MNPKILHYGEDVVELPNEETAKQVFENIKSCQEMGDLSLLVSEKAFHAVLGGQELIEREGRWFISFVGISFEMEGISPREFADKFKNGEIDLDFNETIN